MHKNKVGTVNIKRKLHETFDLAKNCVRLNRLLTVTIQELPRCQAFPWKMFSFSAEGLGASLRYELILFAVKWHKKK